MSIREAYQKPEFPVGFLNEIERAVMERAGKKTGAEIKFRCPAGNHEDRNPSANWNAEKAAWNCHACGCGGGALDLADLLDVPKPERKSSPNGRQIVAIYDYTRDHELLFQALRFSPKGFSQRRPDPDNPGKWIWNMQGVTPALYRLEELEAAPADEWVYVPAGEKDTDLLRSLGRIATTNPMGEGKWREIYNSALAGRSVAILADNDPAGRKHAQDVAASLDGTCAAIKVLELPGLPDKGDVSDWVDQGHDGDDLDDYRDQAPMWEPAPAPAAETISEPLVFETTDMGNAERLVATHGENVRYSYTRNVWFIWNGRYWPEDDAGEMERLAKSTARSVPDEAKRLDHDDYARHMKWAVTSQGAGRLSAMVDLTRSEPGVSIRPHELDRDPWLLNVKNGTINLQTGELREHRRVDLMTRCLDVEYQPDAKAPVFLDFLHRIFNGNTGLISYVQRMMGYALTGDTSEQAIFIAYGSGANGKSTLVGAISDLLGDYAREADTDSFLEQKGGQIREDLAALEGARFVAASESADGRRLSEAIVKKATGGEKIRARRLYENGYEYQPQFKVWISTNHRPTITGTDHAIWRRIRLIPFTVTIPEEERDKSLPTTLAAEGAGILAWMIEGCRQWLQHGEQPPTAVLEATDTYRRDMDALANWLEDRCEVGKQYQESMKSLYANYEAYCESSGEDALKQRTFSTRLTERGYGSARSGSARYRTGIRLRDPDKPNQAPMDDLNDSDTSHTSPQSDASETLRHPEKPYNHADNEKSGGDSDVSDASFGNFASNSFTTESPRTNVTNVTSVITQDRTCPNCRSSFVGSGVWCDVCLANHYAGTGKV